MVGLSKNKEKVERIIVEEITKSVTCDFCGFTGGGKEFKTIEWLDRIYTSADYCGEYKYQQYIFDMCPSCLKKVAKGTLGTKLRIKYGNAKGF